VVRRWAERDPDRLCLEFHQGEQACERVTYGALAHEAGRWARLFRARGLQPGDPVVLLAHSVAAFAAALLGAQQAGLLAVPCPPPEPLESGRRLRDRTTDILDRCGARALVDPGSPIPHPDLAPLLARHGQLGLGPADLADGDDGDACGGVPPRPSPYAYCQFTSGSGGRAKGVLVTHENLVANLRAMRGTFALRESDVAVTWLPWFHDLGLVLYLLSPLMLGYPCHVMATLEFVARPGAWLRLISRVRGTTSAAPNVAYAVCARRVGDAEMCDLDLASWRIASNGGEPVTREAVLAFTHRFARVGFQASAMLPSYGLAENTLSVTSRRPGQGPWFEEVARDGLEREGRARPASGDDRRVVTAALGRHHDGVELFVADAGGTPVADREVGEIAVRGASVMAGYLPGTAEELGKLPDGSLLTGDLGYLADGELFVVGRKKDLIIRGGRNFAPQDLEEAAARIPGVRPGRAAAFSLPGPDGERVILAVEVRAGWDGDRDALRAAVRRAVFDAVRLAVDDVALLPARAIPLTSSGKIRRAEARRLYVETWSEARRVDL
jgi:acyl-CoA synthetase (AMP-forming)/AMP-acid ligase II